MKKTTIEIVQDTWQKTWKKFDEVELTHSSVHHLMAIHTLIKENGYARGVDVAKYLDITRGSVSITLHKLIDKEYIFEDDNKFVKLTDFGQQYVESVISQRRTLILFFTEILDIPRDTAEADACRIEHLLSQKSGEKLIMFMHYLLSDSPEAHVFRKGFRNFNFICQSVKNCNVCENTCFFESFKGFNSN